MLDKTITSALLALRKRIIQEHQASLAHVNALLLAQGVDPDGQIVRPKRRPDVAGQGMMRLMLIGALKSGPQGQRDLAALVASKRTEIAPEAAYKRTGLALGRMRRAGIVSHDGSAWSLSAGIKNTKD